MTKLNKDAYKQAIEQNIKLLYLHMPRSLEREHIETVLNWSIHVLYPNDPTLSAISSKARTEFKTIDSFNPIEYTLNGRPLCSFLHGKGDGLMICTRDPHDDGPCAMTPFDSLVSGLQERHY